MTTWSPVSVLEDQQVEVGGDWHLPAFEFPVELDVGGLVVGPFRRPRPRSSRLVAP